MDQSQPTTVFMPAPSGGVGRLSSASSTTRQGQADLLDPLLDDLLSLGSNVSDLRLPDSHSIGSPMNRSASSPSHFTLSPTWRLTNPVHMEIQENAKLPTFNLDVDRTGSSTYPRVPSGLDYLSSPSSHDASASEESGGKKKAKEKHPKRGSLAERFLQHSKRQSLNAAYAQAGALREHQDRHVGQAAAAAAAHSSAQSSARTSRAGSVADEKKAEHGGDHQVLFVGGPLLGWDVDPTPLSEIQRKQQSEERCSTTGHRRLQLPIPFLPPSPGTAGGDQSPGRQFAAELASTDAVATAAAIASQAVMNGSRHKGPSDPPPMLLPNAELGNDATSGVKRQSSSMLTDRSVSRRQRLNDPSSPTHGQSSLGATTPSKNGPTPSTFVSSIERASNQKSQYGFGPKHVVPAVPASLEAAKITMKPRTDSQQQNSESKSRRSDSPHGSVSTSNQQGTINSGPAYERKKQKAKDARVRLNESIEKMSIAISFAGTQSKQRLDQWNSMVECRGGDLGVDSDANRLRSVLQACVHSAEDAKKWDRPSFVATAALLIESLNAQCEVLMREVSTLHSESARTRTNGHLTGPTAEDATNDAGSGSHAPNDVGIALDAISEALPAAIDESLQETPDVVGKEIVEWGGSKITSRIATFLDPLSLGRCNLVSQSWRRDFSNSETWSDLAIQRFGHYNVRQWRGKLEDEDEGITCRPFTLYNSMDKSNTMPHFSRDGLFLLGEACLPGKVSVWTFLVERSNGETHRSVLRPESVPGNGTYMSLPVVELRTVIQNTGSSDGPVLIREQLQTVDASTRRRGVEMKEIDWDDRLRRRLLNLDGTPKSPSPSGPRNAYDASNILCGLALFESVVVATFIHAKGCSTMSKFVQKSNYTKFHVQVRNGTTIPLVVTFPRDLSHHLEH